MINNNLNVPVIVNQPQANDGIGCVDRANEAMGRAVIKCCNDCAPAIVCTSMVCCTGGVGLFTAGIGKILAFASATSTAPPIPAVIGTTVAGCSGITCGCAGVMSAVGYSVANDHLSRAMDETIEDLEGQRNFWQREATRYREELNDVISGRDERAVVRYQPPARHAEFLQARAEHIAHDLIQFSDNESDGYQSGGDE